MLFQHATGLPGGFPIAAEEGGDRQQLPGIGIGLQPHTAAGGFERSLRLPESESRQATMTKPVEGGGEFPQQTQVTTTATTGVGPLLIGAAGGTANGLGSQLHGDQ